MADKRSGRKPANDLGDWDGSWEAASRRQIELSLAATPAQRLAWLEEALAIAYQSGALPRDDKNS